MYYLVGFCGPKGGGPPKGCVDLKMEMLWLKAYTLQIFVGVCSNTKILAESVKCRAFMMRTKSL